MGRVEDDARALAHATGGDPEQLEFLFAGCVVCLPAPGLLGLCCYRGGGRCLLLLPRDRRAALHEWGHATQHVGFAAGLEREGVPTWRRQLMREEAEAERFAAAYLAAEDE